MRSKYIVGYYVRKPGILGWLFRLGAFTVVDVPLEEFELDIKVRRILDSGLQKLEKNQANERRNKK